MSNSDLLMSCVAVALAAFAAYSTVRPSFMEEHWFIAKIVQERFGSSAVRIFFFLLTALLSFIAYRLIIVGTSQDAAPIDSDTPAVVSDSSVTS